MRIHKDVEYALIAMSAMAREERKFSARELADRFNIPYKLLTRILGHLAGAGYLDSIQGPRGGYMLAVSPVDVTLGSIMEAVHGPEPVASCIGAGTECDQADECTIRGGIKQVQDMWSGVVNRMSLADFMGDIPNVPADPIHNS
jgi:Rrf2 family protein